jgi:flavin reductase (DIM6/NTAB) family NADH-FMN oxidoreductase RutF
MTEVLTPPAIRQHAVPSDTHSVPGQGTRTQMDPRELRNAFGSFATGVTVLTYESEGANYGMTVNSFTSVSMDPPLVMVSLMRNSMALPYLTTRPFAINVMGQDQLPTALQFAGKPQDDLIVDWLHGETAPRLKGSLAHLQCTSWETYEGGDHILLVARVLSFGQNETGLPLIFHRGQWRELSSDK